MAVVLAISGTRKRIARKVERFPKRGIKIDRKIGILAVNIETNTIWSFDDGLDRRTKWALNESPLRTSLTLAPASSFGSSIGQECCSPLSTWSSISYAPNKKSISPVAPGSPLRETPIRSTNTVALRLPVQTRQQWLPAVDRLLRLQR